jgi:acyl-CoA synthetase (AMP-forming)/AMP-acid ligase II
MDEDRAPHRQARTGGRAGAVHPPHSVVQALRRRASRVPGDPYLTVVDRDGVATTLDAGTVDDATRRLADWLRREREAGSGEVIGIVPTNDAPSALAILAVLRAGCAALLLNPADPPARRQEQAEVAGARTILRAAQAATNLQPGAVAVPDPAALPVASLPEPPLALGAAALLFGTSGSTAASKLVVQTHRNAVANAASVRRHHDLRPGQRLLSCLPIHHVNGVHFTLLATLTAGAHAVLWQAFDPFGLLPMVERFRPRVVSAVPPILEALVAARQSARLPADFSYFVSAAAPLPARTAAAVHNRLGARVLQGYGLTETTNFSTTMPRGLSDADYRRLMIDVEIPPAGVALDCNDVVVLDAAGDPVEPGVVGEVCMRGPNVMAGYLNNEEATREAFRGGWFHSQDLGRVTPDADTGMAFLTLTGRVKNMAKVLGETVSLDEMDRALRMLPGVRDAACLHVPHRWTGEEIVAVVAAGAAVSDTVVRAHLGQRFPAAVVPRRIVRVAEVPRTATGKLRRPELAGMLGEPTPPAAPDPPLPG